MLRDTGRSLHLKPSRNSSGFLFLFLCGFLFSLYVTRVESEPLKRAENTIKYDRSFNYSLQDDSHNSMAANEAEISEEKPENPLTSIKKALAPRFGKLLNSIASQIEALNSEGMTVEPVEANVNNQNKPDAPIDMRVPEVGHLQMDGKPPANSTLRKPIVPEDLQDQRSNQANNRIAAGANKTIQSEQTRNDIPLKNGRRMAVVFGNDNYRTISRLDNARADAKLISEKLRELRYEVYLYQDVTERTFKKAIRDFQGKVQVNDEIIFFYAGHAVQLKGENLLLPTDVDGASAAAVRDSSILLQTIFESFEDLNPKISIFIIDACRDNPFKNLSRTVGTRGLSVAEPLNNQIVLYSAGTNQRALDSMGSKDKSRNSIFTRTLAKEIVKPDVPFHVLARKVRNEVASLAKSAGHIQIPALYDQSLSDYVLKSSVTINAR